jgi:DNA-binding NarL/FixJ family response regulator
MFCRALLKVDKYGSVIGLLMSDGCVVPVHVIAPNLLAGEYIIDVLSRDPRFHLILCECLPSTLKKGPNAIFVLDGSFQLLPLGQCIRRLQSRFPQARFVVVDKAQTKERILRLLHLGIHGFVDHSKVTQTLREAVQAVSRGDYWVPRDVLTGYVESTARTSPRRPGNPRAITGRETQVLELVEQHYSNQEIASALGLQESTVKYHVSNILGKLQVANRECLASPSPFVGVWKQFLS